MGGRPARCHVYWRCRVGDPLRPSGIVETGTIYDKHLVGRGNEGMGEAKQRQRLSQRVRTSQPLCVFCGGGNPSETLDHYPPRVIFAGKFRPLGLEFAACKLCNEGSRQADQIIALLSRLYPDSSSASEREEVEKLMHRAERSNPGLLQEMRADQLSSLHKYKHLMGRLPSWNFLRVDGAIVTHAMQLFGAKLGLALHYAETSRIVPVSGAVTAKWYSNLQAFDGNVPSEFLKHCGPGKTLRQGAFSVESQFRFASMASNEGDLSGHFAVFRESFGILMLISEDPDRYALKDALAPGFLR